jgi:AhpD family alkylhydroperoxidase
MSEVFVDFLRTLTLRRKKAHTRFLSLDSKTYKAFLELEKATFCDGALSTKMKELIAIGVSAAANCESCIQWHTEYAIKAGATDREIMEALEVAMEIGGGRAVATARLAVEVMENCRKDDYESAGY